MSHPRERQAECYAEKRNPAEAGRQGSRFPKAGAKGERRWVYLEQINNAQGDKSNCEQQRSCDRGGATPISFLHGFVLPLRKELSEI